MAIDNNNTALANEVSVEENTASEVIKKYKKLEDKCDEIIKKIKIKKLSVVK